MSTPMENQGKSPETIVAEQEAQAHRLREIYGSAIMLDEDWLRSSLSDLLRWSATQMPEKERGKMQIPSVLDEPLNNGDTQEIVYLLQHLFADNKNNAIDDCKATLLRLADEICKK